MQLSTDAFISACTDERTNNWPNFSDSFVWFNKKKNLSGHWSCVIHNELQVNVLYIGLAINTFCAVVNRSYNRVFLSIWINLFFLLLNSFGAKFQRTFVVCFFFYFHKLWLGKTFICKVERLNVKQHRSRWDGSLSRLIWIYAVCKSLLLSPVAVKELNLS